MSASPSGFWVTKLNRFETQLWSPNGEHLKTVKRLAIWFEDDGASGPATTSQATPAAQLNRIIEDDDGLLWAILRVTDRDWTPLRVPRREGPVTQSQPSDQLYDTIIEVWDVRTGVVMVRERFDQSLRTVATPDGSLLFYVWTENALGMGEAQFYRIKLVRSL